MMTEPEKCADTCEFPDNIYCPACGYNLHGAPGERCPECGYSLVSMRSRVCRIPWEHRRELGRFRSFWKTVWLVTFRNRLFCEEYAHTVSYSDARKFRWVTLMHVYIVVLVGTAYVYLTVPTAPEEPHPIWQAMMRSFPTGRFLPYRAYLEFWPIVILVVCFLLWLSDVTDVPGHLFKSRGLSTKQQNTATAMSYYTCGPLAAAVVPVIAAWTHMAIVPADIPRHYWPLHVWLQQAWVIGIGVSALMAAGGWWLNLVHLTQRIMPQVKGRAVLVATLVPCLWLVLAGLNLIVLPFVILCVLVVLASLL